MSNMLYACSILYKTRLPFLVVFNKTDVQDHAFALEWMRDFEAFQEALLERRQTHGEEDGPAYMDSLMNSMSLVLDEFYKHLRVRLLLLFLFLWRLFSMGARTDGEGNKHRRSASRP